MNQSWSGIAASPGTRRGFARWVLKYPDLKAVRPGDILLSRMTSPDWVQVFEKIGGIATEQGGALCHAAVLAREIGIPAVVGIGKSLRDFQDGEMVEVDGTNGTLTKVHAI